MRKWCLAAALGCVVCAGAVDREEYPDFYDEARDAGKGADYVQAIEVVVPDYGSDFRGNLCVKVRAIGMTHLQARLWQQPTAADPNPWGHDVVVWDSATDGKDTVYSFTVKGDEFPNGPATVRILGKGPGEKRDICELQLYNRGGVKWNQGLPNAAPPAAAGMKLVFADDFDRPLSISGDGIGATYAAHKTGGGDFSGWAFTTPQGEGRPFSQRDTYLRIHAVKDAANPNGISGILSSLRADGTGVAVHIPSYFECRFVAQSAPGTWPAFWTLTQGALGIDPDDPRAESLRAAGCDELDVIEAYGGFGPRNPNSFGWYEMTSHFWGQERKPVSFRYDTCAHGAKASWSWTAHTYGLKITETDTIYYCDNEEVGRHPTGEVSKSQPAWFLINYAIGGISGWQIDLERYGNQSDMWVDWVRVYSGAASGNESGELAGTVGVAGAIGLNFANADDAASQLGVLDVMGLKGVAQNNWNNVFLGSLPKKVKTADGRTASIALTVNKNAELVACRDWGFTGNALKAKSFALKADSAGAEVKVRVPSGCRKYDVIAYLTAGVNGSKGKVTLAAGKKSECAYYNHGWLDGKHTVGGVDSAEAEPPVVNAVRFTNVTAPNFALRVEASTFWTGLAALQIVPAQAE